MNKYNENDPHIAELRSLLMKYYDSDVGEPPKPGEKKHPTDFGVGWMDHNFRHDEEASRIPEGYNIDLR